ncbi:MerR family transcriptional regulator [Luteipulveratus sp. YIM 133132]|uniref:MerR family transcriptional regulator n=1 Tax=Luteipulveratus flavus TaxID=3031728 RepID=A0ABT6CC14_9MICO|nr:MULTISPECIES: MerR family transcriptional regulator [unclassified Luteipulveratus]MDE9366536.1 MerR family transcriptional regulator [Luteipulveratus sp. YIM 133132]MDF8266038.1 MerR family transcriptional regulator [Luteipulveratus sp. YIM 133296]
MTTSTIIDRALAARHGDEPISIDQVNALLTDDEITDPLTVAQVAALLDLSPHTLRYYERIGLVSVPRAASGHRMYDADSVRRITFLTRMRLSGMSIRDLTRYVELVDQGESTVPERLALMQAHRAQIARQIAELQVSLAVTDHKIATYGGACTP